MTSLAANVRAQIRRFVVGTDDADDLSDWLDAHAQQIHDAGDPDLRSLTDLTFSLLEDLARDYRGDEEVRLVLQSFVSRTTSEVAVDSRTS